MAGKKRPSITIDESDESDDETQCYSLTPQVKSYKDVEVQTTIDHKKFNYNNQCPFDTRNINFAKLIAFELQRMPEEGRDYIPGILNIIRLLRGAPQLSEIMKYVPKWTDEDLLPNHPVLRSNVRSNMAGKKRAISELDDDETQFDDDATQFDIKSLSPSIISGRQEIIYPKNTRKAQEKSIQTNEAEIIDAMVYRHYKNSRISYTTEALPKIDFHNENPLDERNEDVARLVAFELERMSEESRSNTYPQILNFIRLVRGDARDSQLNPVVLFVPTTSNFIRADGLTNPAIPLNTYFEEAE